MYLSTTIHIMIASPSDLLEERRAAIDTITKWNALRAVGESVVLLPVSPEEYATPQLPVRPQTAINTDVLAKCDAMIAMLWTRIGTPTGVAESGTVEEINCFAASRKPVLLYFSQRPIDPEQIDVSQYAKLRAFKETTRKSALVGRFHSLSELRETLLRDLTRLVGTITVNRRTGQHHKVEPAFNSPRSSRTHRNITSRPQQSHRGLPTRSARTYGPLPSRRNDEAIREAYFEHQEKLWWYKHQNRLQRIEAGKDALTEELRRELWQAAKTARRIERKYGRRNLRKGVDDWSALRGRLSALSWVMGSEWDETPEI